MLNRNKKGQFIKGFGFWTGKKRPGLTSSTSFKKGIVPWNKGKIGQYTLTTPESKQKSRERYLIYQRKYHKTWRPKPEEEVKGNVRIKCKCNCGRELWRIDNRGREKLFITGHNFWKGGVTSLNKKLRGSKEYRLWRTAVFERDDYTCIWCLQRGGVLNADHIKPWCDYPELRFAIDNGRTLCVPCHRTTDTYGIKFARLRGGVANAY